MNEADKLRQEQRARNFERQASIQNTHDAWTKAAKAWNEAGNKEAAERCNLAANECKR